ncbi:Na+/H+ antiporter NhaC family protein [Oceanobacillus profundus]|uniref:YfcC family protein n=1 Tax=Oceanobacillus profundus TaxID=372463 RepID=A0A417YB34_9BACI|nr:Na+/H+ antiporter NhaC family protein [Oceanobacillus profundus]MDO6450442.1 Na+/H+ antiporter NhaC family protein [Oceanobacillus profundus]RHW29903.1 YfcC family protein [Oceanobacillus profundus]
MNLQKKEYFLKVGKSKKRLFKMPDSYILLFIMLIFASIATYLIPAGNFEREEDGLVPTVIPGSYSQIESNPVGFMDFFLSIQTGMMEAANIIFLVLIIGGSFAIIDSTQAINSGIMRLINKTRDKKILLVISVCTVFSIAGFLGILHTAVIAFIPVGVIIARAFKLDAIVGVALIYLGAYSGYTVAGLDPITTGFGQEIAGLPVFSALWYRFIIYLAILISSILYIFYYIRRIENNPERSIMGTNRFSSNHEEIDENIPFTGTMKVVLLYFIVCLAVYTVGVFRADWGLNEMAAIFLIIGIGTAIIGKINPNEFVKKFVKGAQGMIYAALIVGLARSIVVVLEDGLILDTIVHAIASVIEPLPSAIGAFSMYIFNLLFNLIITSGSGQAAIVMPIMAPLADIIGISRQVAVLAYNMGDGFTNTIAPTSGILMASIAVAGVSWVKWLRFMLPLLMIWIVIGAIALAIALAINLGPF